MWCVQHALTLPDTPAVHGLIIAHDPSVLNKRNFIMAQTRILANRAKAICFCAILLFAIASPGSADTVVRFQTPLGDFDVQLYDTVTPITVANFLNYVNDGDYVNSFFHRSAWLKDEFNNPTTPFVLQGGGFTFDADVGIENPWPRVPVDPPILNEYNVSNTRGTIAMAKTAAGPDSATSQFFFNVDDNSANLDNQNGGFTVFGEVLGSGMDVVDLLMAQQVWDASTFDSALTDLPLINYSGTGPWTPTLEMFEVGFLPGDVNANGSIDNDDLNTIITNWGQSGLGRTGGDLDGNGIVDGLDYTQVITYWTPASPTEPPSSVPEPATLAMMLMGALATLIRRQR